MFLFLTIFAKTHFWDVFLRAAREKDFWVQFFTGRTWKSLRAKRAKYFLEVLFRTNRVFSPISGRRAHYTRLHALARRVRQQTNKIAQSVGAKNEWTHTNRLARYSCHSTPQNTCGLADTCPHRYVCAGEQRARLLTLRSGGSDPTRGVLGCR